MTHRDTARLSAKFTLSIPKGVREAHDPDLWRPF
jgi:hypothetical protein